MAIDAELQKRVDALVEYWVGKRVRIVGKHPWSGCVGTVECYKMTAIGRPGFIVRLDSADSVPPGQKCFVFSGDNWEEIGRKRTIVMSGLE